ncbi:hydroxymethylbilane synthase [Oerskovia turbata]|uniref:Porphobilinogen deaminase n=1 Tax=Oerskovia turbata TaxID=1713 RepID=A0A4Q1KUY5_9CELL|nr:hydroxymethylbilane synthase [Oerskovia turbata]RXR25407.1 hydroxymethylbilane synthase [Oerskovia turbata]RXR33952.1 hydroxymethylbilane synthase [Oerskovia turbata]
MSIRVGTRGSALATTQTGLVARRIETLTGQPVEIVRVRTEGDVRTGSLAQMGGTGVFVTALREALLDGRCDVAVHSLKDLPTGAAEGLTLVTPERENPRDALCARNGWTLETLPRGAKVGTGSPRRAAQLLAVRPDLDVLDIRGNVDTRLARALGPDADLDAVVLAYAGLSRLGRLDAVSEVIDVRIMAPAPGQGALGVEVRTADLSPLSSFDLLPDGATHRPLDLADVVAGLDHVPTRLAVLAERALLARLEAGCAAPVGTHAVVEDDEIRLSAVVARLDGGQVLTHSARVALPSPAGTLDPSGVARSSAERHDATDALARGLGVQVADALLAAGAADLAPLRATGPGGDSLPPSEAPALWAPGTAPGDGTGDEPPVGGTDAPVGPEQR